jgi:multidrug efflux pump subunit AcrA (membrane-fusion protein)
VQYRTAPLSRGTLQASVAASGAVNPVSQVSVGTQVSGQIRDLLVDFNSEVKAGQLLAQIDPETFEYRVRSAQADVDAARAAVLTAQANQIAAQTQVSRAQVDLDEARRDFDRKQSLVVKNSSLPKAMWPSAMRPCPGAGRFGSHAYYLAGGRHCHQARHRAWPDRGQQPAGARIVCDCQKPL